MLTIQEKKISPSFGNSFSHGWEAMMKYFLVLLLVVILLGFLSAPMGFANFNFDPHSHGWNHDFNELFQPLFAVFGVMAIILAIVALGYSLLVHPVFEYGGDMIFVQAARDKRPEFETLVKGFKQNYLHIILANVLKSALIMLGMVFLIIPGIIISCRLAFVSYLVMDKKRDPIIAIEESWKLTKGYGWTIFFMGITSVFICILGLLMLFIGILPAIMWTKSAFASLYENILIEKNKNGDEN